MYTLLAVNYYTTNQRTILFGKQSQLNPWNFLFQNKRSKFASQLPLEVQYLILKHVLLNKFDKHGDYHLKGISSLVNYLKGHHPILDDAVSLALQEIWFDYNVFDEIYFNGLAEFIDSRSIQLK
ncbi:unnamed protein product [Ambrosiozyma monospora]|uniref:Unnamed protein product n=1 Tax=Ambrosiozyma monospora TaxID=43982 RepID=A0ACB5SYZ9_AMBMO|nr:unnamed protein product [Ambrosiozyma monospora]